MRIVWRRLVLFLVCVVIWAVGLTYIERALHLPVGLTAMAALIGGVALSWLCGWLDTKPESAQMDLDWKQKAGESKYDDDYPV